jgi:hypothetical protein
MYRVNPVLYIHGGKARAREAALYRGASALYKGSYLCTTWNGRELISFWPVAGSVTATWST